MSEKEKLFEALVATIDRVRQATDAVIEASKTKSKLAEATQNLSVEMKELERLATLLDEFAVEQDRSLQ